MFSIDGTRRENGLPISQGRLEQNENDDALLKTYLQRIDVLFANIRIQWGDLKQTQQVLGALHARAATLKQRKEELEAKLQEIGVAMLENAAAMQKNADKRQENAVQKQQLMEQLAANDVDLNEIQELKRVVEDMKRRAEQLAVKAKAIFPSTEDSDDDLEGFMAGLELKKAARAGATAVLV